MTISIAALRPRASASLPPISAPTMEPNTRMLLTRPFSASVRWKSLLRNTRAPEMLPVS